MPEIIDGRKISKDIKYESKRDVEALKRDKGIQPSLKVILVGDDPASEVYVNSKTKTADKLGILSETIKLSAETKEIKILEIIDDLNRNPEVHGILVQLPLPPQINSVKVLEYLDPEKDVDGLHPKSMGRLAAGHPSFIPCTPYGIWESPVRQEIARTHSRRLFSSPGWLLLRPGRRWV